MKNILNKFYVLGALSAVLFACEKDEEQIVVTQSETITLSASEQTLALQESEADQVAVVFSWSPVEVTWSNPEVAPEGALRYSLQMDLQGEDFSSPVVLDMGTALEKSYSVAELNTVLVERLDLTPFTPANIEVRVKAVLGPNMEGTISEPVRLTVTPYEKVSYATIYMVGDATEFGWDNTKPSPMFISESGDGVFVYTGLFNAGGFKFLKTPGQWAPMWGVDGTSTLVARPTENDPDPNTITVDSKGYYTVTVDTVNLTYSFEAFDASAAPTFESIGIIGAFSNWDRDELMTQSTFDPHIWSIEYEFTEATEIKFRKTGDWGVNWGPATEEGRDIPWGVGVQDGKDINVSPGNYTIYFNDLTGNYMFLEQK